MPRPVNRFAFGLATRSPLGRSAWERRRLLDSAGRGRTAGRPLLEQLEERRLLDALVFTGVSEITNGDTIARQFGAEQLGNTARIREFEIQNDGNNFVLSNLALPDGWVLAEDFSTTFVAGGDTVTFSIALDTTDGTVGAKSGEVSFTWNEGLGDGPQTFTFAVAGRLTPAGGPHVTDLFTDSRGGVWVDFDEALAASVVTNEALRVYAAGADGVVGSADDQRVAGALDYDADTRRLRFTPENDLDEDYRVEIVDDLLISGSGESLDGEFAGFSANGYSGDGDAGGFFNASVDISDLNGLARLDYNLGTIDLELTPDITPITVDNFYAYANSARWDGTFMHRSVEDFVVQGGGFRVVGNTVEQIDTFDPIQNEFDGDLMSNVRGTVAMAKLGGDPDSATSQWFFNVGDNSSNLDSQNGGFTVFARLRDGTAYELMDRMNALTTVDVSADVNGALEDLPVLDNYNGPPLEDAELVLLRRAGSGAAYAPVNFTGLVLDLDSSAPEPPDGVDYAADLGAIQQDTTVMIELSVFNSGPTSLTVTSALLDTGGKYFIAPANAAGNPGDDWQIANADSFTAQLWLNVASIGTFSDTLTLTYTQGGATYDYVLAVEAQVVPTTPSQPDLAPAYDTGVSNADDITNRNNSTAGRALVFVVGNVTPGATVTLYADGVAIGSDVVAGGEDTIVVTTDGVTGLADGEAQITAVQTLAGTDSLVSESLTITIDTSTPIFDPVDDQALTLGDELVLDLQTDAETAGETVDYAILEGPAGATIDAETGVITWQTTVADLGLHDFTIRVQDVAGNVRTLEFDVAVTPEAPGTPDLANWTDSGDSATDDLTNRNNSSFDTRLQFYVEGVQENALVSIYAGDVLVGAATVAVGETTVRVTTDGTTALDDGDVDFTATQTLLGVESERSPALRVKIDATGPIFDEPSSHDLNASVGLLYRLDLNADDEQNPLLTVAYELVTAPDGVEFNDISAIITWTPTLADAGPNDFVVSATDKAGNVTTFAFQVTVAGLPPAAPPDLQAAFDSGNDSSDDVTNRNNSSTDTRLSFLVTEAIPGSIVRIYGDGVLLGVATVPVGQTQVVVTTDGVTTLEDGLVDITASQQTANGESDDSEALQVRIDTVGPVFTDVDPDQLAYATFTFILDLSTDEEDAGRYIRYSLSEKPLGANINPTTGRIVWTPSDSQVGDNEFVVVGEDDAGNTSEYTFTVEVVSPSLPADGAVFESALTEPGKRRFELVAEATSQYMVLLSEPVDEEQFWLRMLDATTLEVLDVDRTNSTRPAAISFEAVAGQRYRLEVESYQGAVGDFTVEIVPDPDGRPEDAAELELTGLDQYDGSDTLVAAYDNHRLDERVDQDFVSFIASTTGPAVIRAFTAEGLAATIELYDGTDIDDLLLVESADSQTFDETAILSTTLQGGVLYYVRVVPKNEASVGRYSLRVAADADFTADFPIDLGTLEETLSLEGTIYPGSDQDWFSFVAAQDGPVMFGSTGSFTLTLRATIEDLDTGEQVANETAMGNVQPWGRFTAVAGHTYRVRYVSIGDTWGDYSTIFAYDEYGDVENALALELTPTQVGSETDGLIAEVDDGITSLADYDWFTFEAPLDGGRANIQLVTTPGLLGAHLTLYTERLGGLQIERVAQDPDATGGFSFDEELSPGATYYVRLKRVDLSYLGDYSLTIAIDGNSTMANADHLGEVGVTPLPVIGETSSLDDVDFFHFTSSIGGAVILQLADAGPDQRLTIYSAATGVKIAHDVPRKNRPAQIRFDAIGGADYLLKVEQHRKQIGAYEVTLMVDDSGLPAQALPLQFVQRPLESETDPLLASVDGEISINLDEDWYTFIAPSGADTAFFVVETDPGVLFSDLSIYARRPDGGLRRIGRDRDNTGDGHVQRRVGLVEGAQYWVQVSSFRGRSAGVYTLRAEIDYNNRFSTADDLGTLTERLDANGFAQDNQDVDIFRVTANENGLLHLGFEGGPFLRARVRLYSVNNTNQPLEQGQHRPGNPPLAMSHAVAPGDEFYIEIRPLGGNSAGAYTLSLDYDPIIF